MENKSFTQNLGIEYNENEPMPPMPNDYLTISIIATVLGLCGSFCCIGLILGIIAIVFSTQVKSKYQMGDYWGAEKSSSTAKTLAIISLVLGILGLISGIAFGLLGGWQRYMEIINEVQYYQ